MTSKLNALFALTWINVAHASTTLSTTYLNGLTMYSSGSPYLVTQDVIIYDDFVIKNNVELILLFSYTFVNVKQLIFLFFAIVLDATSGV